MNGLSPWQFVQAGSVIALHAAAIQEFGGGAGPAKAGCVEGSIDSAVTAALYVDEENPDLLTAAAYVLVYLSKNHCFTDGNKRAGWVALTHALRLNRLRVVADQADAAALVDGIAASAERPAQLVANVIAWLAAGRLEPDE